MIWAVPSFPAAPQGVPELTTVDDAYLTRVTHGPLGTLDPPRRWFRGAVYDADRRLVKSSQRIGGVNGYNWAPADEPRATPGPRVERLEGTWLYGGHWIQHFGHFAIETITTLWPEVDVQGLVFHKYLKRPWSVEPWQARFLELCGYADLPVRVVDGRAPLTVERLVVPGRAVVPNGWAHPEAVAVWDRVVAPFRGRSGQGRVYLSRTEHNERRREQGHRSAERSSPQRDRELDEVFAGAGFEVVCPEDLSLDEQLGLVADAAVVAGASGSALHLSAFAPTSARVLEVADLRSPDRAMPMQLVVDAARGHEHCLVRGDLRPDEVAAQVAVEVAAT